MSILEAQMKKFYDPELFKPVYMNRPYFKEENKMDIPGKLRDDLKRIFGAQDPLNFIEDAKIVCNLDEDTVMVTLRIPRNCAKYAQNSDLRRPDMLDAMRYALSDPYGFNCAGQPAVAKKTFVRPERVFFNGNNTVLVWPDGEKTVVGLGPDTQYDEYAGFCAAIVKKLFGSSKKAQRFLDSVKVVQKKKAQEECCDSCRVNILQEEGE